MILEIEERTLGDGSSLFRVVGPWRATREETLLDYSGQSAIVRAARNQALRDAERLCREDACTLCCDFLGNYLVLMRTDVMARVFAAWSRTPWPLPWRTR